MLLTGKNGATCTIRKSVSVVTEIRQGTHRGGPRRSGQDEQGQGRRQHQVRPAAGQPQAGEFALPLQSVRRALVGSCIKSYRIQHSGPLFQKH